MTAEHDRLLAEGPRVAPEPTQALDSGAFAAPAPGEASSSTAPSSPAGAAPRASRRRGRPLLWRAWLPLVFVALAVSGTSAGRYAWIVPLAIVGLGAFAARRRR